MIAYPAWPCAVPSIRSTRGDSTDIRGPYRPGGRGHAHSGAPNSEAHAFHQGSRRQQHEHHALDQPPGDAATQPPTMFNKPPRRFTCAPTFANQPLSSLPDAADREKPQLLCPVVKTLGFFLIQLVSSPNPAEPYPKSSTQSTKYQKALKPHSALIIFLQPGHEAASSCPRSPLTTWWPELPCAPVSLMPGTCWHTMLSRSHSEHISPHSATSSWRARLIAYAHKHGAPLQALGTRPVRKNLLTVRKKEKNPLGERDLVLILTLPLPFWDKCILISRPQFPHL